MFSEYRPWNVHACPCSTGHIIAMNLEYICYAGDETQGFLGAHVGGSTTVSVASPVERCHHGSRGGSCTTGTWVAGLGPQTSSNHLESSTPTQPSNHPTISNAATIGLHCAAQDAESEFRTFLNERDNGKGALLEHLDCIVL